MGQLKNTDDENDGTQSMFFLRILEKIKETWQEFPPGNVTVLWKMTNYEKARVKLSNAQLNKWKQHHE